MSRKIGKLTIHDNTNIWPHEAKTARALIAVGYNIDFYPKSNQKYRRTADAYINGELWEFKAPTSGKLESIERNLKRGKNQSDKIIFDSRRMKYIPDEAIRRELTTQFHKSKPIKAIKFINRHGEIIDIK